MNKQGFNVPEAYFLSTIFFKTILKENNKLEEYLKYSSNLEEYKENILNLIDNVEIPISIFEGILDFEKNTYAVRSSSTNEDGTNKSFAGQYITELFCGTMEFTIKSIRRCWKSLLGIGLEKYQDENTDNLSGGIIIQKMINADRKSVV